MSSMENSFFNLSTEFPIEEHSYIISIIINRAIILHRCLNLNKESLVILNDYLYYTQSRIRKVHLNSFKSVRELLHSPITSDDDMCKFLDDLKHCVIISCI